MSNDRGVFRLGAYRRAQVEGQGVNIDDVWVPPAPVATSDVSYMVGGLMNEHNSTNSASNVSSQTDKITYSSSTTSRLPGANLDNAMYGGSGMSSLLAMYSGGGPNVPGLNPNQTNVRKLTYASETFALLPSASGFKAEPKEGTQGVGDASNFGYWFAGVNAMDGSPRTSYTQKFTFSYEASARVPSANLPYETFGATAAGDQKNAYVTGGENGGWSNFRTNVSKFTYSDETMADVPGLRLSDNKYKGYGEAAAANSQYIWYAGGSQTTPQGGAIIGQTTVSRIDMSADTIQESLPSTQLTYPTFKHGGVDNGSDGYFAGGNSWNNPGPAGPGGPYSSANKLTFSNGTMAATPGANLTQAKSLMQTAGPRQYSTPSPAPGGPPYRWRDGFKEDDLKAGYYSGGSSNGYSTVTQKVDYATDQTSLVPGGYLPDGSGQFAGANSNSVRTIMSGGEPSGNPFMQFVYATETASNISGSMPSKRTRNNDMGYGTETAGYVTGGEKEPSSPSAYYSSTQKIEFATDTASEVPGANSNWTMRYAGAFGNVDHTLGYVVGGQNFPSGPSISRIQKMTYSTETMANTPANMQNGYFNLGTTSGPDAGYIYSKQEYPGWTSNGAIEKFVYATDSRTTVPQPTYYPRYGANGTGNSTNGYYGGGAGAPSPSDNYRRLLKLNFSTGVGQDMPSSLFPYNEGVYRSAAGSAVSRKKSPKGAPTPTPTPSSPAQPVPNLSTNGYNVGGRWNSHPSYGNVSQSWIMKTSYSSDTTSLSPNKMVVGRNQFGTFSSATAGYILGGSYEGWPSQQPATTNIQKVTYSNDTASTSPGQLAAGSQRGSGVANPITGYVAGGIPAIGSRIQKYTFSTETLSAYIPAQLGNNEGSPSGVYDMGSAGNTTHGYFMGGDVPGNPGYMRNSTKIEYATDTATTLGPATQTSFGDLQGARNFAAVGYGNIAAYLSGREGGNSGTPNRSLLAKLTYSTDSITTIPSTTFNNSNGNYAGHGNETKGFFAGGGEGTRQYKLTYSSESLSLSPSNSWNFPSSVPGSGGPGAYDATSGGAFSARNNDGGKVPVPVVF